jgi:hypothetical protein
MLTILGIKVSYEALAFFVLFIGSEIVGASKLRENSIVQVVLRAIEALKPHRTEDDKIQRIKDYLSVIPMVLLKVKQYYPQTDSATGHGDRMCFSSTCAMAIKYLLPGALLGSNADDDYLRTVLKYGDTTQYTSHLKACQQYGVFATFSQKGTRQTLINELKAGYPVATGILHKGHVSAPRGGGHWMLLIGDDGERGIFHDPYGEMDNVNGGYITIGRGGKDVKYSWRNWLPRWEVEGRG